MTLPVLQRPVYAPHLPPVLAGMNRAGSVGKTTFGYNLCVQAARRGYKVLLVDADLQSDASFWSGWDGDAVPKGVATIHDVMLGNAKLADAIVPGRTRIGTGYEDAAFEIIPNLFIVRGHKDMSQADGELVQDPKGVFWLQHALRSGITEGEYDLIYVDCPASLGRLSISLILAATNIVMCMKPTRKELRGAKLLKEMVDETRSGYEYYGAGAVASHIMMNEAKSTESQGKFYMNIQTEAREAYGDGVLGVLRTSVLVPEAYDAQEPLAIWAPAAPATLAIDAMLDSLGYPVQAAA